MIKHVQYFNFQYALEQTEWTPMFASFRDKYGINWMLSGEQV